MLDRFKVTLMFTLLILIYGVTAFRDIPRETTPTIDIPAATITTVWPGASPGDVEQLITNKIEKEIKNLENIEKYNSVSMSGVSVVSVEFDIESDKLENMQKLREKIDQAEKELPDTIVDDPDINEVSVSDIPIISLTLSGDFSWSELKQFSEILEDDLKGIPKVKDVLVNGAPETEVHILLDPIKLEAQRIGVNEVISAIRSAHRDLPLGQVTVDGQEIEVTVRGELETAAEFMDVPVRTSNGIILRLGDFAQIRREFDTFEVETFFSTKDASRPAVSIDVIKSGAKGNVITMVGEVLGRVEALKLSGLLPQSLNVDTTYSRADDINESLGTLTGSGKQTLILIAIVMLLAIGWRESVLAALAIPLSLLIGIIVLFLRGDTFNGVSLFSLVLSVGLLVDNAIIIVEGLSTGIHEKRMSPRQAAVYTLKTFRWPIITGTLTTLFAFLPMLFFITGVSGQYVRVIPITVMAGLTGALLVSLFLLPSLGVRFFSFIPPKKQREAKFLRAFQFWYGEKMRVILSSLKKVWMVLGLSAVVFLFSISLLVTKKVPVEVFPSSDQVLFTAKAELPEGTELSETKKLIDPIEGVLRRYFEPQENGDVFLKNFIFTVGKSSDAVRQPGESGQAEENVLGITLNLTDKDSRQMKSYEIVPLLRKELEKVIPPFAEFEFSELVAGPPTGAPVEVRLIGQNLERLERLIDQVKAGVESLTIKHGGQTIQPAKNVRDSRSERVTQLTWQFDRDILARFGLTPSAVLETLRASVNGVTAIQLTEGDDEIDVDVRIDWEGDRAWDNPTSLEYVDRIPMKTPSGNFVTLQQVADASLSSELSKIDHRDGVRVMYVRADLERGITASQLESDLQAILDDLDTVPGEMVEIGGESEEGNRLIREMSGAMLAALFLIFLVLVWQFNSYVQPFVILALIPLSLTGVFIGFWILGLPLSFPTMIGIVSLAGIIVNDAIVLIDRINHQHSDGGGRKSEVEGYIEAGKERMQPIFLTSVTTVVGMLPLSLSDEVWGGLGFAVVFGMVLSTVLTLLLIPCFLMVFSSMRRGIARLCKWCGKVVKNE